ncbi:MAG: 16S rRNA (cytosine(1402)-N(4))-methyltransferase, partial [Anaerolineales bacterium]|nr:16S rRNA (cytosine(1402)-N(4))-methyltransferase [Anaerolineales bacterium]
RRPIRPEDSEIDVNPRARSAKLRAAEKFFRLSGTGLAIN